MKLLPPLTITFVNIFDIFCPAACIIGKKPADCKMVLKGTVVRRITSRVLEQVKRTWSTVKVSWLNVSLILCRFHKVTLLDTINNTCFTSWLPRCALFSRASFWRHQNVFDVTDRTPEALSFAYRSWKKCMWIAIIFATDCFYLCWVNFRWRVTAFWRRKNK